MDKYSRIKIVVTANSNKDTLQMFMNVAADNDYKNPPTVIQR